MSRPARAALVGMAALVCLVTAAAAAPMTLAAPGDASATAAPQLAETADTSFTTLMIAPLTAGAVILLAGIALVISATRRGSKD